VAVSLRGVELVLGSPDRTLFSRPILVASGMLATAPPKLPKPSWGRELGCRSWS
jgi:hypothetical protein